eukprot:4742628-Karenia_brevis.AAC.1
MPGYFALDRRLGSRLGNSQARFSSRCYPGRLGLVESPALSPPSGRQHFRRSPLVWPPSCRLLSTSASNAPAEGQPHFTRAVDG